jgi:hypothetical protein
VSFVAISKEKRNQCGKESLPYSSVVTAADHMMSSFERRMILREWMSVNESVELKKIVLRNCPLFSV